MKVVFGVIFCAILLFSGVLWWDIVELNENLERSLEVLLKRKLLELKIEALEVEPILESKPFSYTLHENYCPEFAIKSSIALTFSKERYVLMKYVVDQNGSYSDFVVADEGRYEKREHGLLLSSQDGKKVLMLPFELRKEKDYYTSFLNFYGSFLHPRHCSMGREERLKYYNDIMLEYYPEDDLSQDVPPLKEVSP